MGFVFDTSEHGLRTIMKDYQEICMRFIWETGEESVNSRKAWLHVNKVLMEEERTISRASVINFLNGMVDKRIITFIDRTGKGGHHRAYIPLYDEAEFKEHIARQIIEKLLEAFPDETFTVLVKIANEGAGQAEAGGHPGPQ